MFRNNFVCIIITSVKFQLNYCMAGAEVFFLLFPALDFITTLDSMVMACPALDVITTLDSMVMERPGINGAMMAMNHKILYKV